MSVNGRMQVRALADGAQGLAVPAEQQRQAQWPFPWVYPPPGSEERCPGTVVVAPTNGVLTELVAFQVPDGYFFRVTGLLLSYTGITIDDGSQLVVWNVDVDIPTSAPTALPSGRRIPDFGVVKTHLGSLEFGPWPIDGPMIIDPRSTIRVKVTTTAPFTVGLPCSFVTRIRGYIWPENRA